MSALEISDVLRGLTLKDLRTQLRARGMTPAGSMDVLKQRLADDMQATRDLRIMAEPAAQAEDDSNFSKNNFQRPGGNQNIGNRITDRPSSKVMAPPGGASQITFGTHLPPTHPEAMAARAPPAHYPPPSPAQRAAESVLNKMGLGDTDALVSGARDAGQAAGRPSHVDHSNSSTTGGRLFNTGPEAAYAPHAAAGTPSGKAPTGLSQVAFGDHQLPSYTDHHGKYPEASRPVTPADMMHLQIDAAIRPLQLKELRTQLRARGLSPAGSQEALRTRLGEHMMATSDLRIVPEGASLGLPSGAGPQPAPPSQAYQMMQGGANDHMTNNYSRPGGQQNVGNFITDRASSRVLAPPGGQSQIMFGDHQLPSHGSHQASHSSHQSTPVRGPPPAHMASLSQAMPAYPGYLASPQQQSSPYGSSTAEVKEGRLANNYARPNGQQNVGNFLTDRPSSRVLAPPGGKSQITFG